MVVSILDTANSSYLVPFNVLSQRIKEGSVEANNNLKFLESITTPCQNVSHEDFVKLTKVRIASLNQPR